MGIKWNRSYLNNPIVCMIELIKHLIIIAVCSAFSLHTISILYPISYPSYNRIQSMGFLNYMIMDEIMIEQPKDVVVNTVESHE